MIGCICVGFTIGSILQAVVVTVSIFLSLTVFVFQTKIDFTFLGAALFVALWGLIFGGLMQLWFPFPGAASGVISIFGAIVFSLFILYDTRWE